MTMSFSLAFTREMNKANICPGVSLTPVELQMHFGVGFGDDEDDWDEIVMHIGLTSLISSTASTAKRPSECEWDRVDWFEVKLSLDGYIKRLETHENGRIEVVALTDEARVGSTESGREIYSV